MIKNILRKIFYNNRDGFKFDELIVEAGRFPRYKPHRFKFNGMDLHVPDFLSVAWQLKEIFFEEQMKFRSTSDCPVIVDCGSNAGVSVIYFGKLFPRAKIYAFEPDPMLAAYLRENLDRNKIERVEVIEKAVWTDNNAVSFGSDGADGGSVYLEQNRKVLPSVRLKDFLAKQSEIDFLKMDIEGAEVDVLCDCGEELDRVKNLFVEYHSWKKLPQRLDELLRLLASSGFRYYIRSLGSNFNPLISKTDGNMDIQLNIYATKTSGGK